MRYSLQDECTGRFEAGDVATEPVIIIEDHVTEAMLFRFEDASQRVDVVVDEDYSFCRFDQPTPLDAVEVPEFVSSEVERVWMLVCVTQFLRCGIQHD